MAHKWMPIKGYNGKYEVSSMGEIRKFENNSYTPLVGTDHTGYRRVKLRFNGRARSLLIHRLVAEAFIENNKNYEVINHIDGNRGNNMVENLEWCTQKHNVIHAHKTGLVKSKIGNKSKRIKNSASAIGVKKRGEKFMAVFQFNYKKRYAGTFITEEEARQASLVLYNNLKESFDKGELNG